MTITRTIFLDNPDENQKGLVGKFFEDAGIPVIWGEAPDDADVIIDWPDDKVVCEPYFLHCGGRISCPNAFAIAGRLKIERGDLGNLLNHLNIRITSCQLGCFK